MLNKQALAATEIIIYKIFASFLIIFFTVALIISWPNKNSQKLSNLNKNNTYSCYDWGKEESNECTFGQALFNNFEYNLILLPVLPIVHLKGFPAIIYIIFLLTTPVLVILVPVLIYKKQIKLLASTNEL